MIQTNQMFLFRKNLRKYLTSLLWQAAVSDRLKQMGRGVKTTLGLLEHKGTIPMFLLIYSFNKYLLDPFSFPGTAGKGKQMFSQVKHKTITDCQVSPPTCEPSSLWELNLIPAPASLDKRHILCHGQDSFGNWNCKSVETAAGRDWEKPEVTSTVACSYHWLSLGHPCVRCYPSYSCFLWPWNSVLVPRDQSREAARDQAG